MATGTSPDTAKALQAIRAFQEKPQNVDPAWGKGQGNIWDNSSGVVSNLFAGTNMVTSNAPTGGITYTSANLGI